MRVLMAGLGIVAVGVFFALIFTLPVMWLWNWLCPTLFNLPHIGFWQALGLSLLGRFLFGGGTSVTNSK